MKTKKTKNNAERHDLKIGLTSSIELKKKYCKPRILYYGTMNELTHSSTTFGTGDSGLPDTRAERV